MVRDNNEYNKNLNLDDLRKEKINEVIVKFTDHNGNFDYENFKKYIEEKGDKVIREGYGLNFLGKRAAELLAGQESTTVFVPDIEHNEKEENKNSGNIYISADNLEALRHLKHSYYKKIKCIYIDPPYNTGKDGFCYPDNFKYEKENEKETLSEKLGVSLDEAERILSMESNRTNSHSAWLSFMYARLLIARELLTDDGAIFISIDDNEMANLKLLCDEVFGEDNFIACLGIEINPKGRKNGKFFAINHENCIIYAKDYVLCNEFKDIVPKDKKELIEDDKGYYTQGKRVLVGNCSNKECNDVSSDKYYYVYYKEGKELEIRKSEDKKLKGYKLYVSMNDDGEIIENTYTAEKLIELYNGNDLIFKEDTIYEKDRNLNKQQKTLINSSEYFDLKTESANLVYKGFDLKKVFSMPKNVNYIGMLLKLHMNKNDIVLDFFSGSATTTHAVMELNSEMDNYIKVIAVQLPENLDELLKKSSNKNSKKTIENQIKLCDECGYPHTLDYIGIERIKRAAAKIKEETGADIDYGFKHFTLVDRKETLSKLEEFNPGMPLLTQDEILKEYSVESRIITMLCEDGYGLTPKYEVLDLDGYKAYYIDKRLYLVEKDFDSKNIMALLKLMEKEDLVINKVVIFGYAFSTKELQQLKDNAEKIGIDDDKDIIIKY